MQHFTNQNFKDFISQKFRQLYSQLHQWHKIGEMLYEIWELTINAPNHSGLYSLIHCAFTLYMHMYIKNYAKLINQTSVTSIFSTICSEERPRYL